MPREPKIRWNRSDYDAIVNAVRTVNAKITRTIKKNPELAEYQPERRNVQDIVSKIETRKDYREALREMRAYIRKGAEQTITTDTGNTVSRYEMHEVKLAQQRKFARLEKEKEHIQNLDATDRGESTGLKRGEMADARTAEVNQKPRDINKIRPGREWEKFKESVFKQSKTDYSRKRAEAFKTAYLKALDNKIGMDNVPSLFAKIESMDAESVRERYFQDEQATIQFIYDEFEQRAKIEALYRVWGVSPDEDFDMYLDDLDDE